MQIKQNKNKTYSSAKYKNSIFSSEIACCEIYPHWQYLNRNNNYLQYIRIEIHCDCYGLDCIGHYYVPINLLTEIKTFDRTKLNKVKYNITIPIETWFKSGKSAIPFVYLPLINQHEEYNINMIRKYAQMLHQIRTFDKSKLIKSNINDINKTKFDSDTLKYVPDCKTVLDTDQLDTEILISMGDNMQYNEYLSKLFEKDINKILEKNEKTKIEQIKKLNKLNKKQKKLNDYMKNIETEYQSFNTALHSSERAPVFNTALHSSERAPVFNTALHSFEIASVFNDENPLYIYDENSLSGLKPSEYEYKPVRIHPRISAKQKEAINHINKKMQERLKIRNSIIDGNKHYWEEYKLRELEYKTQQRQKQADRMNLDKEMYENHTKFSGREVVNEYYAQMAQTEQFGNGDTHFMW